MVRRVQQAASALRVLALQPTLVQLLDPGSIFGRLTPHHAVQSFHLLEELPAVRTRSLELAPSIQAACGGAGAGAWARWQEVRVNPLTPWEWSRGHSQQAEPAGLCSEELPEGQAITST